MKFTLKGFFSLLLLISAAGSVMTSSASDCGSCGTGSGSTGCGSNQDCGCSTVCGFDCCPVACNSGNVFGKTFFNPRNQGMNAPRRMMGVEDKIHLYGKEGFYGVASVAVEYQQMFNQSSSGKSNGHNIGAWFSPTGNSRVTYGLDPNSDGTPYSAQGILGGSGDFDVNAINFGVTASGEFFFCPRKSDIIVDLDLFLGLDEIFCGLWARLDIPICHTNWDLNVVDRVAGIGSSTYPADSVGVTDGGAVSVVYPNMKAALAGTTGFGDAPALRKGKVCGRRTDTSVSTLRFDLGYDWFRRENWHLATSIDFVANVGTRPCGEYLFEPLVGNAHMFEVGGSINAAYELWNNCDATQNLTAYLDATVNTVPTNRQTRILGLLVNNVDTATPAPSAWSQYLLLKTFNVGGHATGLERAANITTGPIQLSIPVVADVAFMLQYSRTCLFAGLGYDFWGRSAERIRGRCFDIAADTYAIKGRTQWNGTATTGATYSANDETASRSTIRLDAPADSESVGGAQPLSQVFISNETLDYCPALHPSTYSNGVFGFVGYNWTDCDWQPYVLVGGQVEFGRQNRAFSQWGIIGKGGISF